MRTTAAALLLAVAAPARAGVVLRSQGPDGQEVVSLEGKSFRSESRGGAEVTVFDGAAGVVYQIDLEKKTYQRLDEASGRAAGARMKKAMEQVRAAMTPEQRAQLDAASKGARGPAGPVPSKASWRYEATGRSDRAAGHACAFHRVLRDGKLEEESCFIPWSAGVVTRADLAPLAEMAKVVERYARAMAAGSGAEMGGPELGQRGPLFEALDQAPGFPAITRSAGEDASGEWRIVSITRGAVPAERFRLPPGLRLVEPGQEGTGD